MKGLGNVSFRYFKRAFIKYLKHTHLMAVKTIYCVKRRQAIIIVFFWGGGGYLFYQEVRSWTSGGSLPV